MDREDQGVFEPKVAGVSILVVDDHQDSLDMLAIMLEMHGARVRVAASVADALEAIAAERPDIVVSDLDMPGENGFELIRRVNEIDRALPVVAMTAHDNPEMREAVLAAGFRAHLPKPLDTGEFLAIVASLTAHLIVAVGFFRSLLMLD